MPEQSIAKVYIETELDTSSWERDLKAGSDRLNRIPVIKPIVDQSQLHDLNKTLDIEQRHLRDTVSFFANNPIIPSIDTSRLDKNLNRTISVMATIDQQSVSRSLSGMVLAPLSVPIKIVGAISTGALEGVGRQLSSSIGGSLDTFINKKFGDTIGSINLLKAKLSDDLLGRIYSKGEATLLASQSKLAKKIKDLEINKAGIRDLVGAEDVAIESNANRATIANKRAADRNKARSVAPITLREATQAARVGRYDVADAEASYDKLSPRLEKEIALALKTSTSAAAKLQKIAPTSPAQISESERLKSIIVTADRAASVATNEKSALLDRVSRAKKRLIELQEVKSIANESLITLSDRSLPKFYQEALDLIAPGISRDQVPELVSGTRKAGAAGIYRPALNEIGIDKKILARLANNESTEQDRLVLNEEIRHARDYKFGKMSGYEAMRDKRLLDSSKLAPEKEDIPDILRINKDLRAYSEDVREMELNGKLGAARGERLRKNQQYKKQISSIAGLEGQVVTDNEKVIDGSLDFLPQTKARDFQINALRKRAVALAGSSKDIVSTTIEAQTLGIDNDKSQLLLDDLNTLLSKQAKLKKDILKTAQGDRIRNKSYYAELGKISSDDVWADSPLASKVRNRRKKSPPVQFAIAELVQEREADLTRIAEVATAIKNSKAMSIATAATGKVFAGGVDKIRDVGSKALNVLGTAYDGARQVEAGVLDLAPAGLGRLAKSTIQGAAVYSLLPAPLQTLAAGGVRGAIGLSTEFLSSSIGGIGGAAIGSIGGAAGLAAPAIGGSIIARSGEALLGAALPSQFKQTQRSVKQLQQDNAKIQLLLQSRNIDKFIESSAGNSKSLAAALGDNPSISIEKTPQGIVKAKQGIDKAWVALKTALSGNNLEMAAFLSSTIVEQSKQFIEVNKEIYSELAVGSVERKELASLNGSVARTSRQAKVRLEKFKKGLKQIELVPPSANDEDDVSASSLAGDIRNQITKQRINRAKRLEVRASLRAAQLAAGLDKAEAGQNISESKATLSNVEKQLQNIKAGSIGLIPVGQSVKQGQQSIDSITGKFNKIGETVDIEQPFGDSIKKFNIAKANINNKLKDLDNKLNAPPTDTIKTFGSGLISGMARIGLFVATVGVAISGIQKTMARVSAELALSVASDDQASYRRSLASAEAFSRKVGISTTESIEQSARFRASVEGTGLEGVSDSLLQGTTVFGRAQGATRSQTDRGLLALSQVASKPKLSAEELNQLAESIPGFGQLVASSSGYSQGQLRSLAGKGKIESSDILSNLSPALRAAQSVKESKLDENPQVAIDKIGVSVENLQVKLGRGLLPGVALAASTANEVLKFLNDNLQLLGTAGIVAMVGFVAKTITMTMAVQGLAASVSLARGAFTALMAAAPQLIALSAVTALIDALMTLSRIYSGGDSPTTKMVEEYEKASEAIAKTRGEIEAIGGVKLEGWVENTFQYLDEIGNNVNRALGVEEIKETKQRKLEGQRRLADSNLERIKPTDLQENDPIAIKRANTRIKELQLDAKIAGDVEKPEITADRNKQITDLVALRDKLNLPIQQDKLLLEAQIASLESLVKEGNLVNNAGAFAKLSIAKQQLAGLNEIAGAYANEISAVDLKLSRSVANFSGLDTSLARLASDDSYRTIDLLSGSLNTGTRSTLEFNDAWTSLSRQLSVSNQQAEEARAIISTGEIAQTIAKLQAAKKLPQNLRDTSPEQFQELKDLRVNDRIAEAIKFYNTSESKIAKQTSDRAKLLSDRQVAIAQEDKALQDKYKATINESNKLTTTLGDQTQKLLQSNISSGLRNSLIGISGAVGNYINSTIEIFEKLQEQTNLQTDNLAKQSEITLQKLAAGRDKAIANQQFSGTPTPVSTATQQTTSVGSVVDGGRNALSQPSNMALQSFSAYRNRPNGPDLHNGQDYSGALGADVRSPVAGKVVKIDGSFNWGGRLPSLRGVNIESIDAQGNKIVARYIHIAEKAGNAFKLKIGQQIQPGTILGVIGADGKIGGNDYHVDVKTKVNGKYEDPAKAFARLGGSSTATTSATVIPANSGGDKTRAILDLIARGEVGTTAASGYYKRQNGGNFTGNTFPDVPRGENIGRYQVNRGDYDEARRKDPSIKDFSPANQDKIALLRMKNAGLKGRDKGYTALQAYDASPNRANLDILLRDLGAEWEALRDGKTRYQGRDTGKNYRSKLYGSDDNIAKMLGTNSNIPTTVNANTLAISNAPAPIIEQDYQAKIASLEAQSKAGYEQTNIAIATSKLQASTLDFKRSRQFIVDRRKEAETLRKKSIEQKIKSYMIGNPSSNKDSVRVTIENQQFIDDAAIKQKENSQDNKAELAELARINQKFTELGSRKDLNKDQYAELARWKTLYPKLAATRSEYYKQTQLQLSQDIRIGKKAAEDLQRKRSKQIVAENRNLNQDTAAGKLAIDEALLTQAEQYLSANPYDYKYGDPLTMKKRINLSKERESNAKAATELQEKIDVLDPNAGNFAVQKAGLTKQLQLLEQSNRVRIQGIYSEYDSANIIRQQGKKDYIEGIAGDSIKAQTETQKITASYETVQGRNSRGADTAYLAESAARNQQLKETIATLEKAALLDPRLRTGLKDRIEEAKYQKQILDYTAERVRWTERESNLRELSARSRESSYDLRSLDIEALSKSGNSFDSKALAGNLAKDRLKNDYDRQVLELEKLKIANESNVNSPFYAETQIELQAIGDDLDNINGKKLDALTREFSQFQSVIDDTAKEGTRVLSDMLSGKGVDSSSLNQLLVAPFKAINDQIASFLGGQWSQFVNNLLGGVTEQLNQIMGQAGSAASPSGGSIFSTILNGVVGLFGGGFSSGVGGAVGAELSGFNLNFASGGALSNAKSLSGSPGIIAAMARERFESGGREPVLIVANRDEMVLNPMQTRGYLSGYKTPNYANGGSLSGLGDSLSRRNATVNIASNYRSLELKTTIIDNVETVSIDQLNAALANADRNNRRSLEEVQRQQQDRLNHNVDYRQSIGLL